MRMLDFDMQMWRNRQTRWIRVALQQWIYLFIAVLPF